MNIASARLALFSLTFLGYTVTVMLAEMRGMAIDYVQIGKMFALFAVVGAAGVSYAIFRSMLPLRVVLETLFCGILLTVPIGISTYLAMGANMPLADDRLIRMDEALGFDWRAFIAFVDSHSPVANLLAYAYQSFSLQLLALPLLLVIFGQQLRAYMMVLVYAAVCFVSSFVSIWYPALGTYAVYDVTPSSLNHINAYFGYAFLQQFHAVRGDAGFVFSLADMHGILTFPSVHAAVAVICGWTAWSLRWLRYPFFALNVLMAISAVSHASHYLVDVIAGIGIAAATIAFVVAAFGQRAVARGVVEPEGALPV